MSGSVVAQAIPFPEDMERGDHFDVDVPTAVVIRDDVKRDGPLASMLESMERFDIRVKRYNYALVNHNNSNSVDRSDLNTWTIELKTYHYIDGTEVTETFGGTIRAPERQYGTFSVHLEIGNVDVSVRAKRREDSQVQLPGFPLIRFEVRGTTCWYGDGGTNHLKAELTKPESCCSAYPLDTFFTFTNAQHEEVRLQYYDKTEYRKARLEKKLTHKPTDEKAAIFASSLYHFAYELTSRFIIPYQ